MLRLVRRVVYTRRSVEKTDLRFRWPFSNGALRVDERKTRMSIKTSWKIGKSSSSHNGASASSRPGLRVRTNMKAGLTGNNHNETRASGPGLRIRTNLKAGLLALNHNEVVSSGRLTPRSHPDAPCARRIGNNERA